MQKNSANRLNNPPLRGFRMGGQAAQQEENATQNALSAAYLFWFFALHAPLMLIFRALPILATLHSLASLGLGIHYLLKDKEPTRVAWIAAYITGCELLWRGVGAAVFWEYGKYASLLLFGFGALKYRFLRLPWAWLFLALLIPGLLLMPNFDRQTVSYQLSGLVTMGFASMFFSGVKLKSIDLQKFFVALIAPGISLAILVFFNLLTQEITFELGSNNQITGGIGANQVTSSLSLSALSAFFYILLVPKKHMIQRGMLFLIILLTAASVLTFSRAGLWNTLGSVFTAVIFALKNNRDRMRLTGTLLALGLLGYFVALPVLDSITNGELLLRFSSLDSTGRDVLFQIDYQLFRLNPIFGVGVGQSLLYHPRDAYGYVKATHTEYGRLLAEHGSLGILIIALLVFVTAARFLSNRKPLSKAISASFSVWALLYLFHAATRMVAPSFTFGVGTANLFLTEEDKSEDESKSPPAYSRYSRRWSPRQQR